LPAVPFNERHAELVRLLQVERRVSVADLSARLGASRVTIRKDLEQLEKEGLLVRTHGGAVSAEDPGRTVPISNRLEVNREAKEAIAARAADLARGARSILLDAGSTTLAAARLLRNHPGQITTNSLAIACELAGRPSGSFMLLGGDWRRESSAFIGPYAMQVLDGINADVAFLGASGVDESGFSCHNSLESQVKARIIETARRTYVLADSVKWGRASFSTFARMGAVDAWVTDGGISDDSRHRCIAAGQAVIVAGNDTETKENESLQKGNNQT